MKWKTFQGREVSLDQVDQQHLSNCYWYAKIFLNEWGTDRFLEELKRRFNGQLLPYRPHVSFEFEIEGLQRMRMLRKISHSRTSYGDCSETVSTWSDSNRVEIFLENCVIGEIIYPGITEKLFPNA